MDNRQQEFLIHVDNGLVQAAQVEDGVLTNLIIEPVAADNMVGRIYLGRVVHVEPRLQAAFITIGESHDGFLNIRGASVLAEGDTREADIQDCVAAGDTVLVQITRPSIGDKGAHLTANITLANRHFVLAPYSSRIAISSAITDENERARLMAIAEKTNSQFDIESQHEKTGWIIRTQAETVSENILAADMEKLAHAWDALLDKADTSEAPQLLHKDSIGIERILRDYISHHTSSIIIADAPTFALAQAYCEENIQTILPLLSQAPPDEDLFERYDIHSEIKKALAVQVELASGGWISIEDTQAMTTIDVNSGNHNAPARAVNLEAAATIARQICLRAIGGLIAIDFIDMETPSDNQAVLNALSAGFANDKVPVRIGDMSDFGVVEMTRKHQSLTLKQALTKD
ncbi:MAG: ribonuclease E/G [Alphaproteobacteria bacterium]|nr:ribonuclease E/G [Alphaproteobacteria bacterium]